MFPSRLVALVDELQERRLVERTENTNDRRTYSLILTTEGESYSKNRASGARARRALLSSLTVEQREQLASLLRRVADQQGLQPGVHPGFARLRPEGRAKSGLPARNSKAAT